jgi:CHAD domain-containing protein
MTTHLSEWIESLKAQIQPVDPRDTMAEAGRKVLLKEFVRMLQHEAGSRAGEDIEDVHQMRVAVRRIRSALRLLQRYFRTKSLSPYRRQLRKLARALGAVRDLDVLIADLSQFKASLDTNQQADLQKVIESLEQKQMAARQDLIRLLDGKAYRRFIRSFGEFLTTPGDGAKALSDDIVPIQVRHVLPGMIHGCLASVLAYDDVLDDAGPEMLHGLRIEFKRLRYTVSLFEDVLGTQIQNFIEDLKAMQEHLGRLNDIMVAQENLDDLIVGRNGYVSDSVRAYTERLNAEAANLLAQFPAMWSRFTSRKVQSKLSSALLALR